LLLVITAIAVNCAPADVKSHPEVVEYEFEHRPENGYRFAYKLSDGQFRHEYGTFRKVGDKEILSISGRHGYVDEGGKKHSVQYTADENGFRASGDDVPNTGTGVTLPAVDKKTLTTEAEIHPGAIKSLLG